MLAKSKSSLPPKIPSTAVQLERAIGLLGNRSRGDLGKKARKELLGLIGKYPNPDLARYWKIELRKLVKKLKLFRPEEFAKPEPEKKGKSSKKLESVETVAPPTGPSPETLIVQWWLDEALLEYYLDDEECYGAEFIEQMQTWIDNCGDEKPLTYLGRRFIEAYLAFEKAEDPLEFDFNNFEFDLCHSSLFPMDVPDFAESLVKLALLTKVDFEVIGGELAGKLGLKRKRGRPRKDGSTY